MALAPYDERTIKRPAPVPVATPAPGRAPNPPKLPESVYDELARILVEEAAT